MTTGYELIETENDEPVNGFAAALTTPGRLVLRPPAPPPPPDC
jgi:hypothetical protein